MIIDYLPNFRRTEFITDNGWAYLLTSNDKHAPAAYSSLMILCVQIQAIRNLVGHPLVINSCFRDPDHNKRVGGSEKSQHLFGRAADISTIGWTTDKKNKFLTTARRLGFNGIGIYDTFIHVDMRPDFAHWDMRSQTDSNLLSREELKNA